MPWESRIRREDPNRQAQPGLLRRNPAPAPQNVVPNQQPAAPQQKNNTATQQNKQSKNSGTNDQTSGQGQYQNTTREIQTPTTADSRQQQQRAKPVVEKVVMWKEMDQWSGIKLN